MRASRMALLAAGLPLVLGGTSAGLAPAAAAAAAPAQRPGPAVLIPKADFGGVAAVSAHLAWAVGSHAVGAAASTASQPLILRWNGATWAQVPSPVLPAGGSLQRVAVTSAADGWAVGSSGGNTSGPASQALIEHWDGTSWQQVPSPHPVNSALFGVAAVSSRNAWAVGTITRRDGNCPCRPLVEHWDGAAWKQVATPHPAGASLNGITAVSARSAWAVGSRGNQALIEHWNGTSWKQVPSPHLAGGVTLYDVSAVSARSAWAVGSRGHGERHPSQALIEHWNGTAWKQAPSPASPSFSSLVAVTVLSARSAWAVGSFDGASLIEHWDGTSWKLRIPGSQNSAYSLGDVAATSARNAWAVGFDGTHGGRGLILHWDGTHWR